MSICPMALRRRDFSPSTTTKASIGTRAIFVTRLASAQSARFPATSFEPEARERIKTHIPNCKIIITMRDPVDRLYSMYKLLRHTAAAGRGTFEETLNLWPSMAKGNRYASHLQGWFDLFGRENVLVTMYDELRSDPQQYLNRVTGFVGIDRIALSDRPRIRDDVYAFYRAPRNRRLARKAWRMKHWLKGRQAYGVINLLERAGVWQFCAGRGEPFPPLTPEQDARLRERFLPEVEALKHARDRFLGLEKTARAAISRKFSAAPAAATSQRMNALSLADTR